MKCANCGKTATKYSKEGIPVCSRCVNAKVKAPKCPDCKLEMSIRTGKYGQFWGCKAFPMCEGIRKL